MARVRSARLLAARLSIFQPSQLRLDWRAKAVTAAQRKEETGGRKLAELGTKDVVKFGKINHYSLMWVYIET